MTILLRKGYAVQPTKRHAVRAAKTDWYLLITPSLRRARRVARKYGHRIYEVDMLLEISEVLP